MWLGFSESPIAIFFFFLFFFFFFFFFFFYISISKNRIEPSLIICVSAELAEAASLV